MVNTAVEAELLGHLQRDLRQVAASEEQAIGVAHDVMRLIAFSLADGVEDRDDEEEGDLGRVLDSGSDRLQSELESLNGTIGDVSKRIDERLQAVVDRTDAIVHSSSETTIRRALKTESGNRIVARASAATGQLWARLKSPLS